LKANQIVQLATWGAAIDNALDQGKAEQATALAQLLLRKHARHLPTYERIIQLCLIARRWAEAREWGLRLLRGDPTNALGWAAVAFADERQSGPRKAHQAWQRAVDLDPYNPEIRAGWQRTAPVPTGDSMADGPPLGQATLAFLHLRARRWPSALALLTPLVRQVEAEPAFQAGRLLALWRTDERGPTRYLAEQLTDANRGLLVGWLARADVGDENDKALAQGYIESLDPDGEYAARWLGPSARQEGYTVRLKETEQKALEEILKG
jgi:tetratricopeptide (TPR) repeat protein